MSAASGPSPVAGGSLAGRALLRVIGWYRLGISPLLPPTCRYSPSCSEYALTAVQRFGAARGSWLAVRRLFRCGPWHRGGFDPVPKRRRPVAASDRQIAPELEPQL
jgi:putative membrane protein insertion efficiency factor